MSNESINLNEAYKGWKSTGIKPGFFGKQREQIFAELDLQFNNCGDERLWKVGYIDKLGNLLTFEDIIRRYIDAYKLYFELAQAEAQFLTSNYAFAYDKNPEITFEQAHDPYYLYQQPSIPNQFHHATLNIALEELGYQFQGSEPIQVRMGKPNAPIETWPAGWRWSPNLIPSAHPETIPDIDIHESWIKPGTMEWEYHALKTVFVRE